MEPQLKEGLYKGAEWVVWLGEDPSRIYFCFEAGYLYEISISIQDSLK